MIRTTRETGNMTTDKKQTDGYFGLCPHCHCHDGYINIGKHQWFVCDEHKVKWWAGTNIFSSHRDQTEEEKELIYNERGLGEYEDITFHPDLPGVTFSLAWDPAAKEFADSTLLT
jgi:hypothetical protein